MTQHSISTKRTNWFAVVAYQGCLGSYALLLNPIVCSSCYDLMLPYWCGMVRGSASVGKLHYGVLDTL